MEDDKVYRHCTGDRSFAAQNANVMGDRMAKHLSEGYGKWDSDESVYYKCNSDSFFTIKRIVDEEYEKIQRRNPN